VLVACCRKRNAASWDFFAIPAASAERQPATEADIRAGYGLTDSRSTIGKSKILW